MPIFITALVICITIVLLYWMSNRHEIKIKKINEKK